VYEHALAYLQPGLRKERVVRSDEDFGHGRSHRPIKVGRNLYERILRHNDVFGLRAARRNAEHTLAHTQTAHFLARLLDCACKLKARNLLRVALRRWIPAHALQNVRTV
jgi:hypothetical protein